MLVLIDHTVYRFRDSVKGNLKEKMIPLVVGKPTAETALKGEDWFTEEALGHKSHLLDDFVSGVSRPLDHIKRITLKTIAITYLTYCQKIPLKGKFAVIFQVMIGWAVA